MDPLVLVVDDNADDRQILSTFLRHFGYVVLDVADGAQALKLARDWHPAVAVIDLAMPGLSGTDLAAAFRADPSLERTPLVAISAHHEYRAPADRAGFDVFLEKPCEPEELQETIRRLIAGEPPTRLNA